MEFLQVPETPAPEPAEPDVPDCCADEKIGEKCFSQKHALINFLCVKLQTHKKLIIRILGIVVYN